VTEVTGKENGLYRQGMRGTGRFWWFKQRGWVRFG